MMNVSLKYLRRIEAATFVREKWAMPCSPKWLAKLAVVGGGPIYRKAGRYPIYLQSDLDAWAQSRIGAPQRSSSDLYANSTETPMVKPGA